MNVALLKHGARGLKTDTAYKMFPRLNERGSIEARVRRTDAVDANWFPRLNERGSIEAQSD